ncbi:MAG: SprT family zinc-dependent metalloprotease [Candidatus Gracilibacteria bacterium]|nr:SprT family zinc-dependent metalloprotease [Candidatus Gracilibacteria bacterium]
MRTEKSYRLQIEHIFIDVVKKSIKHMNLSIRAPDGRVRIAAPLRVSDEMILTFAKSKIEWITSRQGKFVSQPTQDLNYVSGEKISLFGKSYELQVLVHQKAPRVVLNTSEGGIELYIREKSTFEQRESAIFAWQRNELHRLVPALISKWEPIMGVAVNKFGIRRMKTRWGTCNIRTRKIWLNLELAKQPLHCIEYLVVHEMTHLLERLHSARFFGYMDRFLPDWRERKIELNGGKVGLGSLMED